MESKKYLGGNKVAKRRKTLSSHDIGAHVEEINHSFTTFMQGFNTNFATIANVVANSMTNDDNRQKADLEKPKILLDELIKLNIPSDDVLEVADIFAANKEKIDIFLNLPQKLRVPYMLKLMSLS
ncbi:myb/SANT-like domain-containing protein [Artemisia annua]|uniref:Myb/SANT-like domain-containing protein n=1 Tax=Artemisia annua TaxID=35608 RepID=A0A2U1LQK7_ARTAN|nr:myb/SANT-like domain-containing protein [Artemisia annua]